MSTKDYTPNEADHSTGWLLVALGELGAIILMIWMAIGVSREILSFLTLTH